MADLLKKLALCLLLFSIVVHVQSATIILTSDQQLSDLLDPDKKIDISTGNTKRFVSLREVCADAQKRGDKTLTIAFDEFFRQYRNQAETVRLLTPDMDEYVEKIKIITDFLHQSLKHNIRFGKPMLIYHQQTLCFFLMRN